MASNYNNPINILDSTNAAGVGSGGSLNVEGGLSVKKDTFIGGSLSVSGTSTAFSDNILVMNQNPNSSKDTGILFERYSTDYTDGKKFSGLVYTETSDEFVFGYANSDPNTTGITFGNYIPIKASRLLLMSTENMTSLTSGGSLTVLGGASISKSLNTGAITTGDINFTGDLYKNGVLYNPGSQWNTVNSNVVYTRGNVGIGTTSPNTTLDVTGTINATTIASTNYTGGSMSLSGDLIVGGSVVTVNITTTNVKDINISTGTLNVSETAYITTATIPSLLNTNVVSTNVSSATLNLSTGLTSASAQITNINSTNISSGTLTLSTGITSTAAQITNANVTAATVANLLNTNVISTNISTGTINATTYTGGSMQLSGSITSANLEVTGLGDINNLTSTQATMNSLIVTGGELRATFNSNTVGSIFTSGGNVGIGTTAPTYQLTLGGGGNVAVLGFDNGNIIAAKNVGGTYANFLWPRWTDNSTLLNFGSTGFRIRNNESTPIMTMTSNGNVGIGTTSPTTNLDVAGTGCITTSLTTGALYSINQTSTNIVAINLSSGTLNLSTGLTSASAQITNINSTNITVGTLNLTNLSTTNITSATLNLSTGITSANAQITNINSTNITVSSINLTNLFTTNITSATLTLSTGLTSASARITTNLLAIGNSNTMGAIITTGGNVGIGTGTPGEMLDVRGNLRVGGSTSGNYITFYGTFNDSPGSWNHSYIGERIYGETEQSELLLFKGNDAGGTSGPDRIRLLAAEHRFDIYTNAVNGTFDGVATSGTTRMTIVNNGNVGIGTTSPVTNIDVVGTGRISTSLTTGALYSTNQTSTNIVSTNITSATLTLSSGLTAANAQITNQNVTTSTISTLLNTNIVSTNVSSGTLNLSTGVTSASAQITNLNVTTSTISSLLNTNAVSTNITSATLTLSTGLTAANARITASLSAIGNSNTLGSIITTGGNVGIGTTSPSYVLHVTGDIYSTGDLISFSDARYKTNIAILENCLEKANAISGVSFTKLPSVLDRDVNTERRYIGFLAQEVEEQFPELVYADPKSGIKSVSYSNMVAVLLECVKTLSKQIEELNKKLE